MTHAARAENGAFDPVADIVRLTDVLVRENAALASGDRVTLRLLAEEKRLACTAYEGAVRAIGATAEAGNLDDTVRGRLRKAADRLTPVSAENRRRLATALAAHKRLMEIISDAMSTAEGAAVTYARGAVQPRRGRTGPPPRALSFNQAL